MTVADVVADVLAGKHGDDGGHVRSNALVIAYAVHETGRQPWADVVLSGAVTPEMLRSNLEARSLRLDPDLLDALREDPHDYWRSRAELPWN